jgi:hypothetical protein
MRTQGVVDGQERYPLVWRGAISFPTCSFFSERVSMKSFHEENLKLLIVARYAKKSKVKKTLNLNRF